MSFCGCKYSFKLIFLWRELEFYTRVHEKMYISFVALWIIKSETIIYNHITIVLTLCIEDSKLLSKFFHETMFFS